MSQQIRVNLMFDANTSAARTNIQQLATLLQQIATPKTVVVNGGAIQQAAQAAQSLQMHLQNAMNVNTGKLDLHKLNTSLKQAGLSLNELSSKLVTSGTQGQQAFQRLATAIAQAGAPAASLGATMTQFLKTMGSAMMWSAAYGALNKITETISDAVNYAKDLNKALTDIAIVSDLSADQLDNFAEKAAKAAKTLNSTTTEYAKAALIFYQQGLKGTEVEERANVVTKMAQVTRESTQDVSDQLTAIWNNFDDGTKSLEYYADAITALGAATASSSKEITQGLEKFAAIADTVGLSYEYATAALATVVANTRQSADVVGTAFKTLFARIQDLELGETLDDGVTLGKYSQAIKSVGVDIMTQNGQLKDMDTILDELGEKWDNLSKAQQTSLAQTVAGMRQYTQFIAIMDNYDEFKRNVGIASDAEGTLTEQWETWADSYEGAAKRVEQRSNELYGALLDDDLVIGVTDAFAGLIGTLGKAAEVMGGLGPIILVIVGLFANKLIPLITTTAQHFVSNWMVMTGAAQRHADATRRETAALIDQMVASKQITGAQADSLQLTSKLLLAKEQLTKATRGLSAAQKEEYLQRMRAVELLHSETTALLENKAAAQQQIEAQKNRFMAFSRKSIDTAGKGAAYGSSVAAQQAQEKAGQAQSELAAAERARQNIIAQGKKPVKTDAAYNAALEKEQAARAQADAARIRADRIAESQKGPAYQKIIGQTQLSNTDEGWASNALRANMLNKTLGMSEINAGNVGDLTNVDFSIANLEKVLQTIPKVRTGMDEAAQATQELDVIMNKVGSTTPLGEDDVAAIDKVKTGFNKLKDTLNLTEEDVKEVTVLFDQLKKGNAAGDTLEKLKKKFQELGVSADIFGGDLEELAADMVKMGISAGLPEDELMKLYNDIRTGAITAEEARVKIDQLNAAIANLKPPNMSIGTAFSNLAGQIGTTASSVSMLVSGIQMLGSAFDEEADPMTRFTSLIMGMSMLLPALNMLMNQQTASTTAASLATIFNTKAKQGNKIATWLLKAANDAENISLGTTIALSMIMLGIFALIIAAIAGIVLAIKALINANRQDEIAVENANKALEKQKTLLEELQTAYDELKSTIEDYTDAYNAIGKLVEGSREWKEAIVEANQQVMSLLAAYPKLAKYVTSVNGVLSISEEGLNYVLDEAWAQVLAQQAAVAEAELVKIGTEQRKASNDRAKDQIGNKYVVAAETLDGVAVDLSKIENPDSDIESSDNMFATAAKHVNDMLDEVDDYLLSGDLQGYYEKLQEVTGGNINAATAVNELAEEALATAKQMRVLKKSLLDSDFSDNKDFQNSKYKDFITTVAAGDLSVFSNSATAYEKIKEWADAGDAGALTFADAFGGRIGTKENASWTSDEKAFAEYLKVVYGEENVAVGKNEVVGSNYRIRGMYGTNQIVEKKGTNGEWVTVGENLSNDQAYINYANAKMRAQLAENIPEWDKKAEQYVQAFGKVLDPRTGETDADFEQRVLKAAADFEAGNGLNFSGFSQEEVDKIRAGAEEGIFNGIKNSFAADGEDNQFAEAAIAAADKYQESVQRANWEASAEWLKNKEQRDAEDLQKTLSAAEMDAEDFEEYVKKFKEYGKSAEAVAKQTIKLSVATAKLSDIFEDNAEILDSTSEDFDDSSAAYISAVNDIREQLTGMLGVDLGYDYVKEHLEEVKKAAEGDVAALDKLSLKAASMKVDEMINLDEAGKTVLLDYINLLENTDLTMRPQIDTTAFAASCNQMIADGKVSMEQLQSYFDSVGFYPEYSGTQEVPGPTTRYSLSTEAPWGTVQLGTVTSESMLWVPKITGGSYAPPTTTAVPATKNKTTKKSSGGSKKDKKDPKEEIERYHVIDRTLDSLSKKYDRLSNAKDRAFGKQHLDYLDEELALLEEEGKAIQQKIEENRKYYEEDRALMAGYGATFDENGNITNYEALVVEQVAKYNKNPDKYGDDYEAFKKALENYESTLDMMGDLTDKEIENINKKFDTQLAVITYQVELEVRLSDDAMALIEFQLENLTDNVGDLAKKLGLLGSSLDTTVRKLTATETALKGLLEKGGINWDDLTRAIEDGTVKELLESGAMTEDQIKSLESELSNMYSYVNELREGMDQVSEFIIAAFEDSHKEFDKSIEQMEYFVSLADSYLNIIELAGRQALGISNDILVAIRKSSMEITRTNISMRKAQLDADEAALANAKAKLLTTTDEGERQEIQESIDEIESKVRESQQALLEETSNGLQAAVDLFGAEMDGIQEKFENSMTGAYGAFAAMKASYDQMQERDDWYLDDYEKIYELSKLNRDIVNSIDETDNIHAKETLRDLQAEINKLQESGAEITQHEVDYLRAKYELRLAEIALEDAQNAKTQVRMRRDSEGNWGYVYTADEAAVGSAQQNYEDKLYAMQKKLNETVDAMEERLIAIPEEYANAVREIYEDQTLNDEERRLRIQETQNHYQEMYARAADLLEATTGRSAELYEVDWTKYSEMTGYKISKNQDWVDSFSETYIATLTGFTSPDGALAQFKKASDTMLKESGEAYVSYRDTIKQMLDKAGIDIANFVGGKDSGAAKMFQQMGDEADAAATRVKQLASDFGSVFSTALDTASKTYNDYSDAIDQWVSKTEGLGKAIQEVLEQYAKLDKKKEEQEKLPEPKPTDPPKSSGGGKGDGDDKDKDPPKTTTYKKLPGDIQLYLISSLQGGFESVKLKKGTQFESASIKNSDGAHYFSGVVKGASNPVGGYIDPDVAQILKDAGWAKFDTGGYTGSWDPSGRLAMLHQKELVLNAHDTANFLSAVDILRDITSVIDLQALSQSNMLSALSSATAGVANQVIEQEVTIHAEFPNATNHSEIEEAFNSLLNRASQFANRKNK